MPLKRKGLVNCLPFEVLSSEKWARRELVKRGLCRVMVVANIDVMMIFDLHWATQLQVPEPLLSNRKVPCYSL